MGQTIRGRPVRYQSTYVWFVFLSALDIMFTWIVLSQEGWEANVVADFVIRRFGLPGLVTFKFTIVIFVVWLCEFIGRRSDRSGQRLAEWAVALTSIPVVVALYQLLVHL